MPLEIKSQVAGTVWKIEAIAGTQVAAGDTLIVLESMKMEIPVDAPQGGTVVRFLVAEKDVVKDGQVLAILE
jgi:acetyl-CoA carboxylase biotin carboxyl carrier protein